MTGSSDVCFPICEHQYHSDYLPKDVSAPSNAETIEPSTQRQKLNPDFDISKTYKSREERTEWHIVGFTCTNTYN